MVSREIPEQKVARLTDLHNQRESGIKKPCLWEGKAPEARPRNKAKGLLYYTLTPINDINTCLQLFF